MKSDSPDSPDNLDNPDSPDSLFRDKKGEVKLNPPDEGSVIVDFFNLLFGLAIVILLVLTMIAGVNVWLG